MTRAAAALAGAAVVIGAVPLVRRLLADSNTQIHRSTPRPAPVTP